MCIKLLSSTDVVSLALRFLNSIQQAVNQLEFSMITLTHCFSCESAPHQLLVIPLEYIPECWQLAWIVLSEIYLALDHERHVPKESVVLEEVSEVRKVMGSPPGILESGHAEEVPMPSHLKNNIMN